MDFSALIADLRDVAEKYKGKNTEPKISTVVYVDMFMKILQRAEKGISKYEDQIVMLWMTLNQLAAIYLDLSAVDARNQLCRFIFSMCAKTVLNIQWPQLDDDSGPKQNFRETVKGVDTMLKEVGFSKFELILELMESHWTHPMLTEIMSGDDVDAEKALEYILKEDAEILKLRIEIMMKEHCEEFALNLCKWSLKHPGLKHDMKVREQQLQLLHKLQMFKQLEEVCERLTCHNGLKIMNHLEKSSSNKALCIRLAQVFLVQDWLKPNRNCCTQELLKVWIRHQYPEDKNEERFLDSVWAVAKVSSNTDQIGILIDGVRKECGDTFIQLYTELCKFAINIDKSFVEQELKNNNIPGVKTRQLAISKTCIRMAYMLKDFDFRIARVSALTAFALDPTKDSHNLVSRLYWMIKKTSATSKGSKITPATLHELERLLTFLRPSYLDPDKQWRELMPLCQKYQEEKLKMEEHALNTQIPLIKDSIVKEESQSAVEPKKELLEKHPQSLQAKKPSLIENILASSTFPDVKTVQANRTALTVKALDKTITDLKKSLTFDSAYKEKLQASGLTTQTKKQLTESGTQKPATSRARSKSSNVSGSVPSVSGQFISYSTDSQLFPQYLTGQGVIRQSGQVHSSYYSPQLAGSLPQSYSTPPTSSHKHPVDGHFLTPSAAAHSQKPHTFPSYERQHSAPIPGSHGDRLHHSVIHSIPSPSPAHRQSPFSQSWTPPSVIRDISKAGTSSPQECAKIAQQIAAMHMKQRSDRAKLLESQNSQKNKSNSQGKTMLNSKNVPTKSQISDLLSLTLKGKSPSSDVKFPSYPLQSPPLKVSSAPAPRSSSGQPAKAHTGHTHHLQGNQGTVRSGKSLSNSGPGALNLSVDRSEGHLQQSSSNDRSKSASQCLMASKSLLERLKQKAQSSESNQPNSTGAPVKPLFSMVVPSSLTKSANKDALVKTISEILSQKSCEKKAAAESIEKSVNSVSTVMTSSKRGQSVTVSSEGNLPCEVITMAGDPFNIKEKMSSKIHSRAANKKATATIVSDSGDQKTKIYKEQLSLTHAVGKGVVDSRHKKVSPVENITTTSVQQQSSVCAPVVLQSTECVQSSGSTASMASLTTPGQLNEELLLSLLAKSNFQQSVPATASSQTVSESVNVHPLSRTASVQLPNVQQIVGTSHVETVSIDPQPLLASQPVLGSPTVITQADLCVQSSNQQEVAAQHLIPAQPVVNTSPAVVNNPLLDTSLATVGGSQQVIQTQPMLDMQHLLSATSGLGGQQVINMQNVVGAQSVIQTQPTVIQTQIVETPVSTQSSLVDTPVITQKNSVLIETSGVQGLQTALLAPDPNTSSVQVPETVFVQNPVQPNDTQQMLQMMDTLNTQQVMNAGNQHQLNLLATNTRVNLSGNQQPFPVATGLQQLVTSQTPYTLQTTPAYIQHIQTNQQVVSLSQTPVVVTTQTGQLQGGQTWTNTPELSPAMVQQILTDLTKKSVFQSKFQKPAKGKSIETLSSHPKPILPKDTSTSMAVTDTCGPVIQQQHLPADKVTTGNGMQPCDVVIVQMGNKPRPIQPKKNPPITLSQQLSSSNQQHPVIQTTVVTVHSQLPTPLSTSTPIVTTALAASTTITSALQNSWTPPVSLANITVSQDLPDLGGQEFQIESILSPTGTATPSPAGISDSNRVNQYPPNTSSTLPTSDSSHVLVSVSVSSDVPSVVASLPAESFQVTSSGVIASSVINTSSSPPSLKFVTCPGHPLTTAVSSGTAPSLRIKTFKDTVPSVATSIPDKESLQAESVGKDADRKQLSSAVSVGGGTQGLFEAGLTRTVLKNTSRETVVEQVSHPNRELKEDSVDNKRAGKPKQTDPPSVGSKPEENKNIPVLNSGKDKNSCPVKHVGMKSLDVVSKQQVQKEELFLPEKLQHHKRPASEPDLAALECIICQTAFSCIEHLRAHVVVCGSKGNRNSVPEKPDLDTCTLKRFEYSTVFFCPLCQFSSKQQTIASKHVNNCCVSMAGFENTMKRMPMVKFRCEMCNTLCENKSDIHNHVLQQCPKLRQTSKGKCEVVNVLRKTEDSKRNMPSVEVKHKPQLLKRSLSDQGKQVRDEIDFKELSNSFKQFSPNIKETKEVKVDLDLNVKESVESNSKKEPLAMLEVKKEVISVDTTDETDGSQAEQTEDTLEKMIEPLKSKEEKQKGKSLKKVVVQHRKLRKKPLSPTDVRKQRLKGLRDKKLIKRRKFLDEETGPISSQAIEALNHNFTSKVKAADKLSDFRCKLCGEVIVRDTGIAMVKHFVRSHRFGYKKLQTMCFRCRYCDANYPSEAKVRGHLVQHRQVIMKHLEKKGSVSLATGSPGETRRKKAADLRSKCAASLRKISRERKSVLMKDQKADKRSDLHKETVEDLKLATENDQKESGKQAFNGEVKRGRGRPRKYPKPQDTGQDGSKLSTSSGTDVNKKAKEVHGIDVSSDGKKISRSGFRSRSSSVSSKSSISVSHGETSMDQDGVKTRQRTSRENSAAASFRSSMSSRGSSGSRSPSISKVKMDFVKLSESHSGDSKSDMSKVDIDEVKKASDSMDEQENKTSDKPMIVNKRNRKKSIPNNTVEQESSTSTQKKAKLQKRNDLKDVTYPKQGEESKHSKDSKHTDEKSRAMFPDRADTKDQTCKPEAAEMSLKAGEGLSRKSKATKEAANPTEPVNRQKRTRSKDATPSNNSDSTRKRFSSDTSTLSETADVITTRSGRSRVSSGSSTHSDVSTASSYSKFSRKRPANTHLEDGNRMKGKETKVDRNSVTESAGSQEKVKNGKSDLKMKTEETTKREDLLTQNSSFMTPIKQIEQPSVPDTQKSTDGPENDLKEDPELLISGENYELDSSANSTVLLAADDDEFEAVKTPPRASRVPASTSDREMSVESGTSSEYSSSVSSDFKSEKSSQDEEEEKADELKQLSEEVGPKQTTLTSPNFATVFHRFAQTHTDNLRTASKRKSTNRVEDTADTHEPKKSKQADEEHKADLSAEEQTAKTEEPAFDSSPDKRRKFDFDKEFLKFAGVVSKVQDKAPGVKEVQQRSCDMKQQHSQSEDLPKAVSEGQTSKQQKINELTETEVTEHLTCTSSDNVDNVQVEDTVEDKSNLIDKHNLGEIDDLSEVTKNILNVSDGPLDHTCDTEHLKMAVSGVKVTTVKTGFSDAVLDSNESITLPQADPTTVWERQNIKAEVQIDMTDNQPMKSNQKDENMRTSSISEFVKTNESIEGVEMATNDFSDEKSRHSRDKADAKNSITDSVNKMMKNSPAVNHGSNNKTVTETSVDAKRTNWSMSEEKKEKDFAAQESAIPSKTFAKLRSLKTEPYESDFDLEVEVVEQKIHSSETLKTETKFNKKHQKHVLSVESDVQTMQLRSRHSTTPSNTGAGDQRLKSLSMITNKLTRSKLPNTATAGKLNVEFSPNMRRYSGKNNVEKLKTTKGKLKKANNHVEQSDKNVLPGTTVTDEKTESSSASAKGPSFMNSYMTYVANNYGSESEEKSEASAEEPDDIISRRQRALRSFRESHSEAPFTWDTDDSHELRSKSRSLSPDAVKLPFNKCGQKPRQRNTSGAQKPLTKSKASKSINNSNRKVSDANISGASDSVSSRLRNHSGQNKDRCREHGSELSSEDRNCSPESGLPQSESPDDERAAHQRAKQMYLRQPANRTVVHKGMVYKFEKGSVKEMTVVPVNDNPSGSGAKSEPVNLVPKENNDDSQTVSPVKAQRNKTKFSLRSRRIENVSDDDDNVPLEKSVQAGSELNEYICAKLNEIRKQRNKGDADNTSKWKVQKEKKKASVAQKKFPYSFTKTKRIP